jgi:hypothetical protein
MRTSNPEIQEETAWLSEPDRESPFTIRHFRPEFRPERGGQRGGGYHRPATYKNTAKPENAFYRLRFHLCENIVELARGPY